MNQELTPEIKAWLDTDPASRDLMAGATLLLRITKNQILYTNIIRNLSGKADLIEYHLQKAYNLRVQEVTKVQVKEMLVAVDKIDKRCGLSTVQESTTTHSEFQRGKRSDHDSLPQEIQKLYEDNALIMKRMRDCHAKLRLINSDNSSCPDSDRYPYAKEIIELDTKYRSNWNIYDHYITGTHPDTTAEATDPRDASKRATKLINLNKGRYRQTHDEELGKKILEWYNQILTPSEKLTSELQQLGLLTNE